MDGFEICLYFHDLEDIGHGLVEMKLRADHSELPFLELAVVEYVADSIEVVSVNVINDAQVILNFRERLRHQRRFYKQFHRVKWVFELVGHLRDEPGFREVQHGNDLSNLVEGDEQAVDATFHFLEVDLDIEIQFL